MDEKSKEDMFEKNGKKYLKSVRRLYQKYIIENDINEHWEILDCNSKEKEQVHNEIYALVMNQYNKINIK
jgi:thymidylate kinase